MNLIYLAATYSQLSDLNFFFQRISDGNIVENVLSKLRVRCLF